MFNQLGNLTYGTHGSIQQMSRKSFSKSAGQVRFFRAVFFFAMIVTEMIMIIKATSEIPVNWAGNSGTFGEGETFEAVLMTEAVVPPAFVT